MKYISGCLAFILLFAGISLYYIHADSVGDLEKLGDHATIIAPDVWALNHPSTQAYVQLAVKRDRYSYLEVTEPDGSLFLRVESESLQGLNKILYTLRLIWVRPVKAPIFFNDVHIGELVGKQYVHVIYPIINILFFLLVVVFATLYMGRLFSYRNLLESQVEERTRNLLESQRRFHDLVNQLPEMVWEADQAGMVTFGNQLATERLGFLADTSNSDPWFTVIAADQRQQASNYYSGVIRGQSYDLQEYTVLDIQDKSIPILLRSAPIIRGGEIVGARCIAIDITHRRDLEEQLHRAQRMEAIGLMAGGVAHDLNNILSGIVTYPELLLLDLPEDSSLRPAIETMRRSGLAAADVVSELLTVARGVAAARHVVNPNTLIREYLNSPEYLQLKVLYPDITLETNLAASIHNISCSPIHIRKCVMNLVTNSMEAIPGKGVVKIITSRLFIGDAESGDLGLPEGDYVVVIVSDTGPGISRDDLSHIFEPFYTKKVMGRSGTGLGLTVVYNTVRDHGGTVNAVSNAEGTTIELIFPAEVSRLAEAGEEEVNWEEFHGNNEKILVVDDEKQQLEIAEKLLNKLGYSVVTAGSGEEAVEFLRDNSVDLLLLDMLMEPGINGRETYEQALQLHPGQKAVIVSGYSESEDVKKAKRMGNARFLMKPYTIAQLGREISRFLGDG